MLLPALLPRRGGLSRRSLNEAEAQAKLEPRI